MPVSGVTAGQPITEAWGDSVASSVAALEAAVAGLVSTINFVIDGGGVVIATGVKGDLVVDFAGTITKWTVLADVSGSIAVAVWRDSYANFPPVAADLIATPTISGAIKAQTGSLSLAVAAGDVLRFNVNSAATITRATVALTITRT